jgi:glycosyltransferase involved in cell wall biosynthesis
VEKVKREGIPIFILKDPIYTRDGSIRRKLFIKILQLSSVYVPSTFLPLYKLLHWPLTSKITKLIQSEKIDVIHLNDRPVRDLFGVLAARKTNTPCISHIRSMATEGFTTSVQKITHNQVSTHIAVSNYIKQVWCSAGMRSETCEVIYNGIEPLSIEPSDLNSLLGIDISRITVCSVGRLVNWKNHSFLLQAFAEFNKQHYATLLIVGSGPEEVALQKEAEALGIDEYVVFTGSREDAKQIMAAADIFVLPSRDEPCARTLLEAMELKVPIVVSNSGGNPELIQHNKTGKLIELEDVEGLAQSLTELSENPATRKELAENAYENVQTNFRITQCITQIEDIYERALTSHSKRSSVE